MALLFGDRVRIEFVEELRQHFQLLGKGSFELRSNRICAGLDATQELFGHANSLAKIGERETVKQANQTEVGT